MAKLGKRGLKMVETNWDEIEKQVKEHRTRRIRWTIIIACIVVGLLIAYYFIMQHKSYTDYRVVGEVERTDTAATHYVSFGDGYLKYSNDGAAYVDTNNQIIWNQGYEMENPMVSTCQDFMAIADKQGEYIYVLDDSDMQGEITVNMPISKIDIASQGNVAVLMEESGTSYLSLFDKKGSQLAEGAIHVENGGTPMDIAISDDGKKLAVSVIDVNEGMIKTTVTFYNFSKVGQNEIDNIVATFSYENTVIPKITYVNDSTMIAFADNGVITYSGNDIPKETQHLEITDEEIMSVFYDDSYFGLVFADSAHDVGRSIDIFNLKCEKVITINTNVSYDTITFLDNHEICLFNDRQCGIYTLSGLEKFVYEFEDGIRGVFHDEGYRGYIFMKENVVEHVRLKFLSGLFGTESQEEYYEKNQDETDQATQPEADPDQTVSPEADPDQTTPAIEGSDQTAPTTEGSDQTAPATEGQDETEPSEESPQENTGDITGTIPGV